jgi:hypothetical protein
VAPATGGRLGVSAAAAQAITGRRVGKEGSEGAKNSGYTSRAAISQELSKCGVILGTSLSGLPGSCPISLFAENRAARVKLEEQPVYHVMVTGKVT